MSAQLLFSLIGDSNLKRNMNPTNCVDRPQMTAAQVILCSRFEVFAQSLRNIRQESNVVVLACVSNFLTLSEDTSSTLSHRVDPILDEFFSLVSEDCQTHPDRKYLVCPPMYRRSPLWYRDGLPVILTRFSLMAKSYQQSNLGLLPSFSGHVLEADGIHLTAYSGLEYVLHLFASVRNYLTTVASAPEARQEVHSEAARLLEDRVVALEQDHHRLSSEFDLKTAIKAESDDVTANERTENFIVVSGLSRVAGRLSGKEWQDRAQADVQRVIQAVVGATLPITVVHNSTGPSPTAEVTYSVQMAKVEDARAVRQKFGSFFQGGKDSRPPELARVSIQNLVTRETRIRISIMKLLAQRYLKSNPGAKTQVVGYLPRPILKITPPPEAKSQRVRSFNFIEAVQKLPTNFTKEEVGSIAARAAQRFPGQLRSLFIVISDDMVPTSRPGRSKRAASPTSRSSQDRRPRVDDEFEPETNE